MDGSCSNNRLFSRYVNHENEIYYLNSEGQIEIINSSKGKGAIKRVNIGEDDARLKVTYTLAHLLSCPDTYSRSYSLLNITGM